MLPSFHFALKRVAQLLKHRIPCFDFILVRCKELPSFTTDKQRPGVRFGNLARGFLRHGVLKIG